MFCTKCGKEISDDSQFCIHCGAKQNTINLSPNNITRGNLKKIGILNKKIIIGIVAIVLVIAIARPLVSKVFSKKEDTNTIVGTWVSKQHGDILKFDEKGNCTLPFTYNGAWLESADNYTITKEGKLVVSSTNGHANDSFIRTEDSQQALTDNYYYYLSEDTLIIDKDTYERTK